MEQGPRVGPRAATGRELPQGARDVRLREGTDAGAAKVRTRKRASRRGGAIRLCRPRRKRRRGKGSGVRSARVTVRGGDVSPRVCRKRRLAAVRRDDFEGRERVARMRAGQVGASASLPLASGNAANPMAGSVLQQARVATKEKAVGALGKREDGTRTGAGCPVPKETSAALAAWVSGSGLRGGQTAEGRSLDNPKRGSLFGRMEQVVGPRGRRQPSSMGRAAGPDDIGKDVKVVRGDALTPKECAFPGMMALEG